MPEVRVLLLSPFGRYSPSQVGIVWEKKNKKIEMLKVSGEGGTER